MNSKTLLIILILVAFLGVIIYSLKPADLEDPANQTEQTDEPQQNPMVSVYYPLPNEQVSSPLAVQGEARGSWYFEASFPAKLYDGDGNLLGEGQAQAQSDWMTTDFVTFNATLTFPTPSTATGTLVLEKDNPSGLPENADSVSIPVSF